MTLTDAPAGAGQSRFPHLRPGELEALAAAEAASAAVRGTTSPNPPVGAAIVDVAGNTVGVGATRPAGGPHAEVMALSEAGERARGGTAVVTLEPCNHTGRTGPCTHALVEAGITRVVFARRDANPVAGGGAEWLRDNGVEVVHPEPDQLPAPTLDPWLRAIEAGRPAVTLKFAQTLDGFTAAADGTSQWITGPEARRAVHADRAHRDAIIVGTGTVLADNPRLTARRDDGTEYDHQPRRVVIGTREVPAGHHLAGVCEHYPDIDTALTGLWESGARDVLVEGGAGLAAGFVAAGVVDFVQAYLAPKLLGAGHPVLGRAVTDTLSGAFEFETTAVRRLGADVFVEGVARLRRATGEDL